MVADAEQGEVRSLEERLGNVFARVFGLKKDPESLNACRRGDSGGLRAWDSLNHMVLISQLENEFDVFLDVRSLSTIIDMRTAINEVRLAAEKR